MSIWKTIAGTDDQWVGHDASERFPVYTRGNAGEVYPNVFTPLSFSIAAESGERAMRAAVLSSGLIRPEELADLPVTTAVGSGVFGGYAYLNLSIQRLASARFPGGKASDADVAFLGVGEDAPPHEMEDERNLRASLAGLRFVWKTARIGSIPKLADDQNQVAVFLAGLPDPATATDAQLARAATDELIPLFADLFETHLKVSFSAGLMTNVLGNLCEQLLDDELLGVRLLAGLGDVDSAAPALAMWTLAKSINDDAAVAAQFDAGIEGLDVRLKADPRADRFRRDFDDFIKRFGSRGPNEWDTAFDTWETEPQLALTLIDRMRATDPSHDPTVQLERLAADRVVLEAETLARLKGPIRPMFRRVLTAARLYSQGRERAKTTVVRAIHGSRLRAQELDRRLVERAKAAGVVSAVKGDLWFTINSELDAYMADPASFAETIAARRRVHSALSERTPPFFLSGPAPALDQWERRDAVLEPVNAGDVLTGLPGCLGVARGRARVVTDPADPRGLGPGDVLIAPITDPSWTPLFVPAEAVVVDVGAVMSHAVIVSRELGIPCAVSVTNATRKIPDGAIIEVDGSSGTVTIISIP
jgi:phosphohistidine swiveling domain-containing protein